MIEKFDYEISRTSPWDGLRQKRNIKQNRRSRRKWALMYENKRVCLNFSSKTLSL